MKAESKKTIDCYSEFAEQYEQYGPKSFYHKYIEKPAMYSALPEVRNKKVLCVGVGSGDEAHFLTTKGAKVIGIDASKGMVDLAKKKYPGLKFLIQDMDEINFPDNTFDFIYSSLALHYSKDIGKLFLKLSRTLKKDGVIQFSTTHPVFDSIEEFTIGEWKYKVIGTRKNEKTGEHCALGEYFSDDKKRYILKGIFYKRIRISEWVNELTANNFTIMKMIEPMPIKSGMKADEDRYNVYMKRPLFMIFVAKKNISK